MSRYILVDDDAHEVIDHDVDVPAFVMANDLDPDEVSAILALPVTGRRVYGGGAAPQCSLIKVEGATQQARLNSDPICEHGYSPWCPTCGSLRRG